LCLFVFLWLRVASVVDGIPRRATRRATRLLVFLFFFVNDWDDWDVGSFSFFLFPFDCLLRRLWMGCLVCLVCLVCMIRKKALACSMDGWMVGWNVFFFPRLRVPCFFPRLVAFVLLAFVLPCRFHAVSIYIVNDTARVHAVGAIERIVGRKTVMEMVAMIIARRNRNENRKQNRERGEKEKEREKDESCGGGVVVCRVSL
jgi:hypothetical protein